LKSINGSITIATWGVALLLSLSSNQHCVDFGLPWELQVPFWNVTPPINLWRVRIQDIRFFSAF
jgi:hypothetical protein